MEKLSNNDRFNKLKARLEIDERISLGLLRILEKGEITLEEYFDEIKILQKEYERFLKEFKSNQLEIEFPDDLDNNQNKDD